MEDVVQKPTLKKKVELSSSNEEQKDIEMVSEDAPNQDGSPMGEL